MTILTRISRRAALTGTAACAGTALLPALTRAAGTRLSGYPFTLGVASGDPSADGFVIWTRLAPHLLEPDGGMPPADAAVDWEVAETPDFRKPVASGTAQASPAWGHAVHVEVAGLRPARPYWYRFRAGGEISPAGQARTAPAPGAAVSRLRACFASCQHFEAGYYAAHLHMAAEAPDLILFLGDYIYEGPPGTRTAVRLHLNPEPVDLDGYRVRYATYKSDPSLQAAHAAAPWMAIWDDHEVANDYGGAQPQDDTDPAVFLRRRAAAYQAFYEHMPLRRAARPAAGGMTLYRALDWGALAQVQLIDNRQYRALRACEAAAKGKSIPDCEERRAADRSILGEAQEAWLLEALKGSRARWNVLAQQTLFGPLRLRETPEQEPALFSRDGWDGYPATRERIAARWTAAQVSNPLVLGGDIHTFAAGDVLDAAGAVVASEFVGGSISSLGREPAAAQRIHADNPRLALFDPVRRGYGRLDLADSRAEIAFRSLRDARDPQSPLAADTKFVVENGRKGLLPG